jgi:hypothetical protein
VIRRISDANYSGESKELEFVQLLEDFILFQVGSLKRNKQRHREMFRAVFMDFMINTNVSPHVIVVHQTQIFRAVAMLSYHFFKMIPLKFDTFGIFLGLQ